MPLSRKSGRSPGTTLALDDLHLEVRRGELLAVLGPNSAGKSTAISLLLGLHEPDTGSARLFGFMPDRLEARSLVGVMMQEVGLAPELRVRELIDLTTSYYPSPFSVDQTLTLTNTTAIADRPFATLSAGQKRQVQFALAVCGRPSLLFLDEPTVGLDVQARETLWAALRQLVAQGASIVLTTHYLEGSRSVGRSRRRARQGTRDRVRHGGGDAVPVGMAPHPAVSRAFLQGACANGRGLSVRSGMGLPADRRRGWRCGGPPDPARGQRDAHDLEIRRAGLAEAFTELTQEAALDDCRRNVFSAVPAAVPLRRLMRAYVLEARDAPHARCAGICRCVSGHPDRDVFVLRVARWKRHLFVGRKHASRSLSFSPGSW